MEFIINIPELFSGCSGIYKITNNLNSKVYIGRTKNLLHRAKEHAYNFRKGFCNKKIDGFIKSNPDVIFTFDVIDFTESIKEKEEEEILKFNSVECGFNILHKDEEFSKYIFQNKTQKDSIYKVNKIMRKIDFSKTENYKPLNLGYIRIDGKFHKNKSLSKKILEILDKTQFIKEKKQTQKDKDWKPADLSWLF